VGSAPRNDAMIYRIPPLALFVVVAALMYLLALGAPILATRYRYGLGLPPILLGACLAIAGVVQFRRADTTVDPRSPEKASTLVTDGVYEFTRNPMYLGFVLMLGGWVAILASPASIAIVALYAFYLDRVQIPPEEAALKARFGAAFDDYAARVRRWL